jgi:hypothetical protein
LPDNIEELVELGNSAYSFVVAKTVEMGHVFSFTQMLSIGSSCFLTLFIVFVAVWPG